MLITDFRSVSGILRILPGFASNATGAMSGWAAICPRLAGAARHPGVGRRANAGLKRDEIRLGRDDGPFFFSCPGYSAAGPGHSTLHGVVFAILYPALQYHRRTGAAPRRGHEIISASRLRQNRFNSKPSCSRCARGRRAPAQNCETMEARADEGTSAGIIKRSPRRSNNIRRSNALDRIRGKRWEHLFPDLRIAGSHQPDRLDQTAVQPGLAPGFLKEHLAIERPMFRANVG